MSSQQLLLLLLATLCSTGTVLATPEPSDTSAEEAPRELVCRTPKAVAHSAQRLCSGTPITDAMLTAGLSASVADTAAGVLLRHGFETVLDLRLLIGQQLQEELAIELKTSGLRIGDRAKIQLLVGDGSLEPRNGQRRAREFAAANCSTQWTELINGGVGSEALPPTSRRQQQIEDDGGLSMDTLAIVLSLLVGAAGCELLLCVHNLVRLSSRVTTLGGMQMWCKRTARGERRRARTRKRASSISASRLGSGSTNR